MELSEVEVHLALQLLSYKMDAATRVQILDESVCLLFASNALGKRYETIYSLSLPLPAMSK